MIKDSKRIHFLEEVDMGGFNISSADNTCKYKKKLINVFFLCKICNCMHKLCYCYASIFYRPLRTCLLSNLVLHKHLDINFTKIFLVVTQLFWFELSCQHYVYPFLVRCYDLMQPHNMDQVCQSQKGTSGIPRGYIVST